MSHIVTIEAKVQDPDAVVKAAKRLLLEEPHRGRMDISGEELEGIIVQLPEWVYPVICDTKTGRIHYDNYEGRWGEQRHLDSFLQLYAVEAAKNAALNSGMSTEEQQLEDGTILVTATGY